MATPIDHVNFYETAGGDIVACVYTQTVGLTNVVGKLDKTIPLPVHQIVPAAKEGFPFAPAYNPEDYHGKSMQQLETDVVQLGRWIARVYGEAGGNGPTELFPENCTPVGRMFCIRWFF